MIEIVALILLGKKIGAKAVAKGRKPAWFTVMFVWMFIEGYMIGGLAVLVLWNIFGSGGGFLSLPLLMWVPVYLAALGGAVVGAYRAFLFVEDLPELGPATTVVGIVAHEEARDRTFGWWSVRAAYVLHIVFFIMNWNFLAFGGEGADSQQKKAKIYVVKQVKFKPPPKTEMQQIPKPKIKKVPIPDPTPDEPEPIRDEKPQEDIDFIPDDNLVLGIPDAPPPPEPEGPIRFVVGGNITEPVKLSGPNPIYPEAARRARIQGVVVLECIIGKDGVVTEAKVLRGLPLGLTEAAVDAVKKWRFQSSTLNGKPVEVLYILTVRFNLQ